MLSWMRSRRRSKNFSTRRSAVGSHDSSTLPRGSALTVVATRVQLLVTVPLQAGIAHDLVIGSPDCRRKFPASRTPYGSVYEPLALRLCRRPPLTPLAFTNALFGFERLVSSTVCFEYV